MKKYKIFKNWHFSLNIPRIIKFPLILLFNSNKRKNKFSLYKEKLLLTNSCKYDLQNIDQKDWNKLIGFTVGLKHPDKFKTTVHFNSFRVGWRYNIKEDCFDICYYIYFKGERLIFNINNKIRSNEVNTYEFIYCKGYIDLLINNKIVSSFFIGNIYNKYGWKLNPYFGGNLKSPHTMIIEKYK